MAVLKTNYVDDVLDTSVNEKRKYNMIQNADGTVSFDDVTTYTQNGDSFGAKDVNDTNTAVNELNNNLIAENLQPFQFAYDNETGKYGYKAKVEGADTFFPFSSGLEEMELVYNNKTFSTHSHIEYTFDLDGDYLVCFIGLTWEDTNSVSITPVLNSSTSSIEYIAQDIVSSGASHKFKMSYAVLNNCKEGDMLTVDYYYVGLLNIFKL